MYRETHLRSVVKALSWRLMGTLATSGIVLVLTGKLMIAASVGALELLSKLLLGFAHERLWSKVRFGIAEARPVVVWITGLPGSGKTELAESVYRKMKGDGRKVEFLDGGTVRHLFPELGFSSSEIDLHIKRIGHLVSRLEDNGVSTVNSFVSPYRSSREFVKNVCTTVLEIHVDSSIEECERRLGNDFYSNARENQLPNVPGISYPFEAPLKPDLRLNLSATSVEEATDSVLTLVRSAEREKKKKRIPAPAFSPAMNPA